MDKGIFNRDTYCIIKGVFDRREGHNFADYLLEYGKKQELTKGEVDGEDNGSRNSLVGWMKPECMMGNTGQMLSAIGKGANKKMEWGYWFKELPYTKTWESARENYGSDEEYQEAKEGFVERTFKCNFTQIQFTVYKKGHFYDFHSDNSGENVKNRVVSMIMMLSDKDDYVGGDLHFEDGPVERLEKGDIVIFPSNLKHKVDPIKLGERCTAVIWFEKGEK